MIHQPTDAMSHQPVYEPRAQSERSSALRQTNRVRLTVQGAVQGVGFRPFVYRLANALGLAGWVENTRQGVTIEVEGPRERLSEFQIRLAADKPPLATILTSESAAVDPRGIAGFEIRKSPSAGACTAIILPDLASCPHCIEDILDPENRRYQYPFTNCTNCGPRFSIIESLPYDRPNTSMKRFTMCAACRAEYENPVDRRFHAQPNACPSCGPRLQLWDASGQTVAERHEALWVAADSVRNGQVLALKGLGGFQLWVDPRNGEAVNVLRHRKGRDEKPFAMMVRSMEQVMAVCKVTGEEARLLESPAAPIVLLRSKATPAIPIVTGVAPSNPYWGVMLPYTPLHHLLLRELDFPVVATSGNFSDEPICIDEHDALIRLRGIADVFLVHNRPIVRHVDDSVARVIHRRAMLLRRARGYAPLPIADATATAKLSTSILAVGAHQKNTVAFARDGQIFVSQHIGDLVTKQAYDAFKAATIDLPTLYDAKPLRFACDFHPDYLSTKRAYELGPTVIGVQHHHAHIVSCMAENGLDGTVLGASWDGTGYGPDGTIWGGEFLLCNRKHFDRVAHLRLFPLPGGDLAAREPRRSALGLLYTIYGDGLFDRTDLKPLQALDDKDRRVIRTMLARNLNCPLTSSMGRLFDAVASIIGIGHRVQIEGRAAMELEFLAERDDSKDFYPFSLGQTGEIKGPTLADTATGSCVIDWAATILAVLEDMAHTAPIGRIARRFHNTLVEMIAVVAQRAGQQRVLLSGGCFQNRLLAEAAITRLAKDGFQPYWHQWIPPNDGGIALGQAVIARERLAESTPCA